MDSFAEFVKWLASGAALGALSAFGFQALKAIFPSLRDDVAKIGSVIFAALLNGLARTLIPVLPQLPPAIDQYWPVITWLWSQVVWEIWLKDRN